MITGEPQDARKARSAQPIDPVAVPPIEAQALTIPPSEQRAEQEQEAHKPQITQQPSESRHPCYILFTLRSSGRKGGKSGAHLRVSRRGSRLRSRKGGGIHKEDVYGFREEAGTVSVSEGVRGSRGLGG